MIGFSQVIDSVSVAVLLIAVNVAIAATIISAVSFVASRIRGFSSPVRHAICVCGVVGVVVAPLPVLSLAGWTWGLVEIIVKDRSAPDHRNHGFFADRKYATHDVMLSESSTVAQSKTESDVIDATTRQSPSESAVAESRRSATIASPKDTGPASSRAERFPVDGAMFGKIVLLTWILGSLIFLLRRLVAEYRLRRWLAGCIPISDPETLQAVQLAANAVGLSEQPMLRRLAVEFRRRRWLARRGRIANVETLEAVQSAGISVGLTKQPILLRSRTLPAPVVCGVMQPTLILPEAVTEGLSRNQLVAVLTHELAHVARRDLVTGVWLTIARITYWWNPLVRILCSRTENLSEQICDDIATASLPDPRDYASALLRFAERATNFTQQPASLGLSMSTISQLEIRIRRILLSTRSTSLRVSAKASVIVVLMTCVLAVTASMMQIGAASDETSATENVAAPAPMARPTLDELLAKIGAMETTYLPFQISVTETMRINEELTPEQRKGIRYADGREHKRLMEHGMLERKVWFSSETSQTDGVRDRTYLSYADGNRNVQAQPDEAPVSVYIDENADRLMWFTNNSPLMGVVPLSNSGGGDMFLPAVRSEKCMPTLTWDGDDAVLEFSFGEPRFHSDYRWTLSREHDWHPVRLKTWLARNEQREQISDWAATELAKDASGVWRIQKGSVGYFSWGEKSPLKSATGEPMPFYWRDFVVDAAAYGDAVDRAKFKYEIPKNASIRTAEKVKPKMPTILEDRELLITVVNARGEPIDGATVRTSTGGHELELLTTDDSGQVTSKKRGADSVSIVTEAAGFRQATLGVGGAPPALKIIMIPQTDLTVVDEDGQPLGGIFVGSERFASMQLDFDRNGFPERPNLNFGKDPKLDRTTDDGHFRLTSDITLRTVEDPVPIWAVSDNGDQFGWMWVSPADLDQPQTLVLKWTSLVEIAMLLKKQLPEKPYYWSIQDSTGSRIVGVQPNLTPADGHTLCHLKLRLPPGDYFLRREIPNGSPPSSVIGFKVEPDQARVDLGLVEELSDAIDPDAEMGSVYGRIQVTNPQDAELRPKILFPAGQLPNIQGNVLSEDLLVDSESGGLEGAFVYLAKAAANIHPDLTRIPATPLTFDMLRFRFVPHTMIVRAGQQVELINSDPVAANMHSFPLKNQAFNMLVAPGTKSGLGNLITNKTGESLPFKLTDDLHPWMQAYWLVVDHPYAAITDTHGRFVIENLPPGPHVFKVWHERVGLIERKLEIIIKPGEVTAQPTIPVEAKALSVR